MVGSKSLSLLQTDQTAAPGKCEGRGLRLDQTLIM